MKKTLVILSGSGISQESGLKTFRDMGGIWEKYDVTEVATPEAWEKQPGVVLRFYNERRKQLWESKPNEGHLEIAKLEKHFNVEIITQNVDDLHERAGSTKVLHLHGELKKARSTVQSDLVYTLNHWELKIGDICEKGSQLRPHIVWFGEMVTEYYKAQAMVQQADLFVVIGTSLAVYPAASLIHFVSPGVPVFVIDPQKPPVHRNDITFIQDKASHGMKILKNELEKLK